ncbi:cell division protein ZipA [Oceanospirillum sediminis]|uniref:Cell division protein ZipA n=1 Tax=Oceanospirillum sediminis TaxID=2760088 RepID=A0A839ILD6_9GAMM|nr:cell division protein ZipA [Oceanospirillum sediminis]MBB1485691.1 cell division protein ZipA [Oceanospirillum sediminis]
MGLQELLIVLGGVVIVLIIVDGIRRMRKPTEPDQPEEETESDPEDKARREEIRRELPNGGARVVKTHNPETFENDPFPVLRNEVEIDANYVPSEQTDAQEDKISDKASFTMPEQMMPEATDNVHSESSVNIDNPAPEPEITAQQTVSPDDIPEEIDRTDSAYFDHFCQPESAEADIQAEMPATAPAPSALDEPVYYAESSEPPSAGEATAITPSEGSISYDNGVAAGTADSFQPVQADDHGYVTQVNSFESQSGYEPEEIVSDYSDISGDSPAIAPVSAPEDTVSEDITVPMEEAFREEVERRADSEEALQQEVAQMFEPKEPEAKEDPVQAAIRRIKGKHTGPRPSEVAKRRLKSDLDKQAPSITVPPEPAADPGTFVAETSESVEMMNPANIPGMVSDAMPLESATTARPVPDNGVRIREKPVKRKPVMSEEEERSQFAGASELMILHVKSKDPAGFPGATLLHIALACGMQVGEMQVFHRFRKTDTGPKIEFSMVSSVNPGTFDIDSIDELYVPGVSFIMALPAPESSQECFTLMLETAKVVVKNLNGELRDENRGVMTPQTVEHYRQRIQDFERRRQLAEKAASR